MIGQREEKLKARRCSLHMRSVEMKDNLCYILCSRACRDYFSKTGSFWLSGCRPPLFVRERTKITVTMFYDDIGSSDSADN